MAAEDTPFEAVENTGLRQLQFHFDAVGARRDSDASVECRVKRAHCGRRAINRHQLPIERLIAARAELHQPIRRNREAGARFDECGFIPDGLADKNLHRLFEAQMPAQLAEHLGQHAVGDGFGVDEHAVAVEEYGVEREIGHRAGYG